MPSHICSYNEVSTRQHHAIATSNVPIEDKLLRTWAHYVDGHPIVSYAKSGLWQQPIRTSDFVSQADFHKSDLYNEFYKFVDTEFQIHVPIGLSSNFLACITYNRDAKDFSERDRLILDLLRPHLYQSYKIAEVVTRQSALVLDDESHLDEPGRGIMVLSRQGSVILMTRWAREKIEYFYGALPSLSNALPEPLASWITGQLALHNHESWRPSSRTLRSPERAGRCLRLVWVDRGLDEQPLLILEEAQQGNPYARLSKQMGLSLREAEVLFWVAQGKSTHEIAIILGIKKDTVRTHIRNAYPKIGASTRAEATAMIWRILAS